ncbi:hypothetical protein P20495_2803 [Pseudoalteromonas sp. BSi20495]|nr:hypothetical protein P20495_2803 [Pseudoalteromonas sp. BSi20495]
MSSSAVDNIGSSFNSYDDQVQALSAGRFKDPFSFLGAHKLTNTDTELRLYLPTALNVVINLGGKKIKDAAI